MDSKNQIFQKIDYYDKSSMPLWEYTIHRDLENIVNKNNIPIDENIKAELMAFAFFESDKVQSGIVHLTVSRFKFILTRGWVRRP